MIIAKMQTFLSISLLATYSDFLVSWLNMHCSII